MPILRKLKSLIGRDESSDADHDVTVTVEHDPENEAAVKGTDHADRADAATDTDAVDPVTQTDTSEPSATEEGEAEDEEQPADEEPTTEEVLTEAEPAAEADDEGVAADEPEADDVGDDADAGEGASESVDVLNGIGPAYASRLEDAGVDSVADLAAADAAELAEASDIAEGRIQGWIEQAQQY